MAVLLFAELSNLLPRTLILESLQCQKSAEQRGICAFLFALCGVIVAVQGGERNEKFKKTDAEETAE